MLNGQGVFVFRTAAGRPFGRDLNRTRRSVTKPDQFMVTFEAVKNGTFAGKEQWPQRDEEV